MRRLELNCAELTATGRLADESYFNATLAELEQELKEKQSVILTNFQINADSLRFLDRVTGFGKEINFKNIEFSYLIGRRAELGLNAIEAIQIENDDPSLEISLAELKGFFPNFATF